MRLIHHPRLRFPNLDLWWVSGKGLVTHNALAVISFNKEENTYNFQSYMSNGRSGSFKAELIENKLFWYPVDNIRYIIFINDEGQWYETGEMNRNEQWFQFFEMTLDKEE